MNTKHQLQFFVRERPDRGWSYHSMVEPDIGAEQIRAYVGTHGEGRTFDYRIIPPGSKDWMDAPAPAIPQQQTNYRT